jgi:hypothetical protein
MSGGHAFSKQDIEQIKLAGDGVSVEVITPKTILRPAAGFVAENARQDLESVGYAIAPNECVVYSPESNDRVVVMALSRDCADAIAMLGVEVQYTSPLNSGDDMAEGLYISLYDDVIYIRVYRQGLRFAEAVEANSDADIVYILENLNHVYNIYNMRARVEGDVKRLERVCRRYTKLNF